MKEKQAIDIISFLITEYRRAFNHGGDYNSIEETRKCYCDTIKKNWNLSENELHIIYLKGKIDADEKQLKKHQDELTKIININEEDKK